MDNRVKALWVGALRSGEYLQGRKALRRQLPGETSVSWCCLGVLCDVMRGEEEWREPDRTMHLEVGRYRIGGHGTTPPLAWMVDWGIRDGKKSPADPTPHAYEALMRMNDAHRNTFEEIADYIEENL